MSKPNDAARALQIDRPAFQFLPKCSDSKFDFTSAEAIHPKNGILPPRKALNLMKGGAQEDEPFDFDSFSEVHGTSKGEDFLISECKNFFKRQGIACQTENISLTSNILSALKEVLITVVPADSRKILVPTPTFGYYFQQFKDLKIEAETLPTLAENGFLPNPAELEEALIRSGAKVLLLCYPNNPTGAVMTEECAHAIAEIAHKHDVFVISDEAFLNNSLSEKKHFPIAAVEGMLDRSFTVTSIAKSMFIGQKTGFCVSRPEIADSFALLGGYPTKHSQKIIAAAIEDSPENQEYLEKCRQHYLGNIGLVEKKLSELNTAFCAQFAEEKTYTKPLFSMPDATNVYLLDFSGLRGKKYGEKTLETGLDIAEWLLKEVSIGTVPGECFLFNDSEMLVRMALNDSPQKIEMAFNALIEKVPTISQPLQFQTPSSSPAAAIAETSLASKAAAADEKSFSR
jgi:aspartate/methionine/tyrosine aminotransferase